MDQFNSINELIPKPAFVKFLLERMFERVVNNWSVQIDVQVGPSRRSRIQLRTYCQCKMSYSVRTTVQLFYHLVIGLHLASFDVGGTNTWTDIFEGLYEERRLCPFSNFIENESHIVLLNCYLHNDLITALMKQPFPICLTLQIITEQTHFIRF